MSGIQTGIFAAEHKPQRKSSVASRTSDSNFYLVLVNPLLVDHHHYALWSFLLVHDSALHESSGARAKGQAGLYGSLRVLWRQRKSSTPARRQSYDCLLTPGIHLASRAKAKWVATRGGCLRNSCNDVIVHGSKGAACFRRSWFRTRQHHVTMIEEQSPHCLGQ